MVQILTVQNQRCKFWTVKKCVLELPKKANCNRWSKFMVQKSNSNRWSKFMV